jgi:hypothetical protein
MRDLKLWETLMVSSMMQRPINTIIECDELMESKQKNLKSAIAFAALTLKDGYEERDLFRKVVEIPHYESKIFQLLDYEDEEELVLS